MINAIVEVLVVELFIGTVKFSDPDSKPKHDVFLFHEWHAVFKKAALLRDICLS